MRRVFAIGETVLDIIFKDEKPVTSTPGGAMLNTAVSLGRLGTDVYFISEYGTDRVGGMVDSFLARNGINTGYVYRYQNAPSSLALAFLDKENNASYNFYKQYPAIRLNVEFPEPTHDDIILYGSFYGIDPKVHERLSPFLKRAREAGSVIIYDPNFRAAHLKDMDIFRPVIMENFSFADIIKGSDEDFKYILDTQDAAQAYVKLRDMCKVVVYTANKDDVHLILPAVHETFPVPPITPVSTIGAGDTFNAGLIYGLIRQDIFKEDLNHINESQRTDIIHTAIEFAGQVCMSYENYLPQNCK